MRMEPSQKFHSEELIVEIQKLSLADKHRKSVDILIDKSHKNYIDLNSVIDWSSGVNRTMLPKRVDSAWTYGTPYWDKLTEEQRKELVWQENARDASMFIWLEETLPTLFGLYINKNREQLTDQIYEYMMIFSKEEIIHTLMFRRYMKVADLQLFPPPNGLYDLFVNQLPNMHPIAGVLCTYLVENVAEMGALHATDFDSVEPNTRQLYRAHHFEEARHLAFGRWLTESYVAEAPPEVVAKLGGLARSFMSRLIPQYTYNEEISSRLSFDLGINTSEAVDAVRRSPNNQRINAERFDEMLNWMKELGLAPRDYQWF